MCNLMPRELDIFYILVDTGYLADIGAINRRQEITLKVHTRRRHIRRDYDLDDYDDKRQRCNTSELGHSTICLSMSVAAPDKDLCYFCSSERMEDRGEGWRIGEQEEEEEARLQHCRTATRFATGRDWS